MKNTILLIVAISTLIACKKETENTEETGGAPTNSSDSTFFKFTVNNGQPTIYYDAYGFIDGFDPSVLSIQCKQFPTYPDFYITGLPMIAQTSDSIVDTLNNPIKGNSLWLNMYYRVGNNMPDDYYSMNNPQIIVIDRHDTIANNVKAHFENYFYRSNNAMDSVYIKGEFNIFYN